MAEPVRVLIAAADRLARAGLATLLLGSDTCAVVGEVSGASLGDDLPLYEPDVILWDMGWEPAESVLADLAALGGGGPPVVALLPGDAPFPAVARYASGLLLRDASPERLAIALAAVAAELVVRDAPFAPDFSPEVGDTLPDPPLEDLTPREMEVLNLLAEGMSNRAIGQALGISEHTVKFHVNAILGKLNAQSRTDAVVRATRLGLILL